MIGTTTGNRSRFSCRAALLLMLPGTDFTGQLAIGNHARWCQPLPRHRADATNRLKHLDDCRAFVVDARLCHDGIDHELLGDGADESLRKRECCAGSVDIARRLLVVAVALVGTGMIELFVAKWGVATANILQPHLDLESHRCIGYEIGLTQRLLRDGTMVVALILQPAENRRPLEPISVLAEHRFHHDLVGQCAKEVGRWLSCTTRGLDAARGFLSAMGLGLLLGHDCFCLGCCFVMMMMMKVKEYGNYEQVCTLVF
mmetsp:Transcript_8384/g.24173  ORF Transcript_8384/g.24173 Transcript_8384/m.24173 type:complete len:258 (-) Transcript_8384:28-801(-)